MNAIVLKSNDNQVQLVIEIQENRVRELSETLARLANESNLRILLLLAREETTVDVAHKVLRSAGLHAYRESTYKALEKLRKIGLVKKEYRVDDKRIVYSLALNK